jgi:hypothetical protein
LRTGSVNGLKPGQHVGEAVGPGDPELLEPLGAGLELELVVAEGAGLPGLAESVGAGLEPWIEKFIRALPGNKPAMVEAVQGLDLITEIPRLAALSFHTRRMRSNTS